jgi:DNA-binding beta-propeller fold protein YncE
MEIHKDYLYIGDGSDDTVKTFDAETGQYLGIFVTQESGNLHGPRGLIFDHHHNLLVTNQNVDQPQNGDVLKYKKQTGQFLGELVSSNQLGAPFAPRGIVLSKHNVLFVADIFDPTTGQGEVRMYDGSTGMFLGNLDHSGFNGPFHPRGLVFGPDGLLYVSVLDINDPLKGWVLRFNTKKGKLRDVFIESNSVNDLHRPEGLVFNPDGDLYVTSFRGNENDTDKILIFDGETGKFLDKIDLDVVGQPRAFAQALLFGPDGKLFVPITGDGPDTGSVRRYNVHHHHKTFDVFVPPASLGGPLGMPWYLTFGNTNPATLAYGHDQDESSDHHHHDHHHDESSDESSS